MRIKLRLKKLILVIAIITLFIIVIIIIMHSRENDEIMSKLTDEQIKSLQYVTLNQIEEGDVNKRGVTIYNKNLSYRGLNLYVSTFTSNTHLMGMYGEIMHTWSRNDTFYTIMYPDGDLLLFKNYGPIARLDWDSKVKWINDELYFHHDMAIADNGDIYSLSLHTIINESEAPHPKNYVDSCLVILSPSGKVKKKVCLLELFKNNEGVINPNILDKISETTKQSGQAEKNSNDVYYLDPFHLNGLYIINRDISGFGKKGDVILSLARLNLILVLDVERGKIVWTWGEEDLNYQHSPRLLDNNNVLIFDNGFNEFSDNPRSMNYSRIIELNPVKKEIVWEYVASPKNSFYSSTGGEGQQLPNINILITESTRGHAFEITREGKVVWEFYGPVVDTEKLRGTIYRMERIDPEQLNPEVLERINWTMN